MSYCQTHHTNNCIECAIEKQTNRVVEAIERSSNRTSRTGPSASPAPPSTRIGETESKASFRWPCWLGGHDWRRAAIAVTLDAGTPEERRCNILCCKFCPKTKVSYSHYPPRRMPSYPPGKGDS